MTFRSMFKVIYASNMLYGSLHILFHIYVDHLHFGKMFAYGLHRFTNANMVFESKIMVKCTYDMPYGS